MNLQQLLDLTEKLPLSFYYILQVIEKDGISMKIPKCTPMKKKYSLASDYVPQLLPLTLI